MTPGHGSGHNSFSVADARVLVVGDGADAAHCGDSLDDAHCRVLHVDNSIEAERALTVFRPDVALVIADPQLSLISEDLSDYRAKEVRLAIEPLVASTNPK